MSLHEKERKQEEIHTPREKVIHNPILSVPALILIPIPASLKNVAWFVRFGKQKSTNISSLPEVCCGLERKDVGMGL